MSNKYELPSGWSSLKIGDVASINERNSEIRDLPNSLDVTFLPMASVDAFSGTIATPEVRTLGEVRKGFTSFCEGDVIFAKITPSMENGKAAVATSLKNKIGFGSTEFHVMSPSAAILAKYLYYFVRQESFRQEAKRHFAGTAGQMRVPGSFLAEHSIPLAPISEQGRIVTKIEELSSEVDSAIKELRLAHSELRRYRISILSAACSGKLVQIEAKRVRSEGRSYESGAELLKRILQERREKWSGRGTYKEPRLPDTAHLPELPDGWTWASVEQIGYVSGGLTKNAKNQGVGNMVPYLRVANVYANELRLNQIESISVKKSDLEKLQLKQSDLLIVEGNGSKEQIGRVAMWKGEIESCVHQNHIIKLRTVLSGLSPWILYWLLSPYGRSYIEKVASSTSGLYTLSVNKIAALPVPLPSEYEQKQIILELERQLSITASTVDTVSKNLLRANNLSQSILRRAFTGKLVPQNENDEPSSVLLERIKAKKVDTTFKKKVTLATRGRPKTKPK